MPRTVGFEEEDETNTEELGSEDLVLEKQYSMEMKNPVRWNLLNNHHKSSWLVGITDGSDDNRGMLELPEGLRALQIVAKNSVGRGRKLHVICLSNIASGSGVANPLT
jgi:hypothetical protein